MSTGTDSADFRYLLKLSGTSIMLQSLGWIVSTFPFFMFFAYMPLIGLCYYLHKLKMEISMQLVIIILLSFLLPGLVKFFVFEPSLLNLAASLTPTAVFIAWFYSGQMIGSLRGFYFIVFWLGAEYIFISLDQPVFTHIPGGAFRLWGESMGYVRFLGFQGTSLWLVLTNLLFAHCFFDEKGKVVEKINRLRFALASLVGVLPMVISMLMYSGNPEGDLTELFANASRYMVNFNFNPFYSIYLDYGEYLGKLSIWLSAALLLSMIVKQVRTGYGNQN